MSTLAETNRHATEDLLLMPDANNYELVNESLVKSNMGWASGLIGGSLFFLLYGYGDAHQLGKVAPPAASDHCFPEDPTRVHRPDVSFICRQRLPVAETFKRHCFFAPDLLAEAVSPNDLSQDVEDKLAEYLAAGVRFVWVVNPSMRSVRVHRADGSTVTQSEQDAKGVEDMVPDWRCRFADLFVEMPVDNQQSGN